MKKLLLLITLTLAMSLLMVSCGDDDETTGPSTLKIGEMNAKVGGADFKAQNAIYYNIPRSVAGVKIDLSNPINGVTKTVSVILTTNDANPEVKKYNAVCFYQESSGIGMEAKVKSWSSINGTCDVTAVTDKDIKATFTFTGTNDEDGSTKAVNGSFFVSRQ